MEYKTYYDSPVGLLELVSDGEYLTHVLYQNQQLEDGRVEKDDIKQLQSLCLYQCYRLPLL